MAAPAAPVPTPGAVPGDDEARPRLPVGTRVRILASEKAGHVASCLGLAQALGVTPDVRRVAPRGLFRLLAPFAPPDPRDRPGAGDGALGEPFPDIAIASARETVACLRAIRKRSGGRVFTVFLGDPRVFRGGFDLIWAPLHDRLRGANVIATLTPPHLHSPRALEARRMQPDPRLAALPGPRVAMLIGGPNARFAFGPEQCEEAAAAAARILEQGASVMISPSRRTPERFLAAVRARIAPALAANPPRAFLWSEGDNPYPAMLAQADAFVVTADSVNMIAEALAAGKPVHVLALPGRPGKFALFLDGLREQGRIRVWNGALESWPCQPLDATEAVASALADRYRAFVDARGRADPPN